MVPTDNIQETLIYVLCSFLGLLLVILGFGLKAWYNSYNTNYKALLTKLDEIAVAVVATDTDMKHYGKRQDEMNARLNAHSRQLILHDNKIALIKQKLEQ